MLALAATLLTAIASTLLLRFDRNPVRMSWALWLPTIWFAIACSRPVSNWMTFSAPVDGSNQYIDGSPLDRNILTLLVLLAFITLFRRGQSTGAIIRINTPLLIFFGYCFISMLWADFPFVLLKRWIRSVADVAMVCIILTERDPNGALKQVLTWIAAFLLPLSILFTRFFPSLGRSYTYSGVPMWTGVATDKNALGALCMITGIVLVARGLSIFEDRRLEGRWRRLAITGTLFAMAVYLLAVIDSKTALACFAMALTLVVMCNRGFRQPWLLTGSILAMIGTCYSVLFLGLGSSAIAGMGRDTSLTGRTQVWEIVIPFAVNPWVGAGFENFWIGDRLDAIVRAVGAGLNQAHNGYIELYLNIGWVGLALLAAMAVSGYANIMAEIRTNPEMVGLKLAFFFICLVYNFTEAAFKIMAPVWIVFLWATIRVPKTKMLSKRPLEVSLVPPPRSKWHSTNPVKPWPAPP